jgi:hypothetical protein
MTIKYLLPLAAFLLLSGCGSENNAEQALANNPGASSKANTPSPKAQKRGSAKWEIHVEGFPVLSGRVITGSTMNGFGNYSLANSNATASIRLAENNPAGTITIKYKAENMICSNFGDATTLVDGNKAILSGTVGCFPKGGNPGNQKSSTITGWFELKE